MNLSNKLIELIVSINDEKQSSICDQFKIYQEIKSRKIGYSETYDLQKISYAMTILGILFNGLSLFFHFKGIVQNVKYNSRSMDRLILVMIITNFFQSCYYLFNSIFLYEYSSLNERCNVSLGFLFLNYFLICFNITFTMFVVKILKLMVIDPIDGILKADKNFKISIIISLLYSIIGTVILFFLFSFGISPMLTPFIRIDLIDFSDYIKSLISLIYLLVPYVMIFYYILSTFFHKHFRRDEDLIWTFGRFVVFSIVVLTVYFFFFILYIFSIISSDKFIHKDSWLRLLSKITYFLLTSEGIFICLMRIFQGHIKIKSMLKSMFNNSDSSNGDNLDTKNDLEQNIIGIDSYHEEIESKMIQKVSIFSLVHSKNFYGYFLLYLQG